METFGKRRRAFVEDTARIAERLMELARCGDMQPLRLEPFTPPIYDQHIDPIELPLPLRNRDFYTPSLYPSAAFVVHPKCTIDGIERTLDELLAGDFHRIALDSALPAAEMEPTITNEWGAPKTRGELRHERYSAWVKAQFGHGEADAAKRTKAKAARKARRKARKP